jgi:ABC-type uncharacterized transport system permease subunit
MGHGSLMDRWLLIASTLLAVIGSVGGMVAVHHGKRSRWTAVLMAGVLVCQIAVLALRGGQRGVCPLADRGEILVFLAWSLTLFYLLVGPAYRISLLGVFTAPVVVVLQLIALVPGVLDACPQPSTGGNPWHEMHSATSVLAYGAFALASVAGVMFLVLDRQLKEHHLQSGLFRHLPPVRGLLVSLERLLWLGCGLLTLGILAGFLMPHGKESPGLAPGGGHSRVIGHLLAALAVWAGYFGLLIVKTVRGLTGRQLALLAVAWFVLSLGVFAFV